MYFIYKRAELKLSEQTSRKSKTERDVHQRLAIHPEITIKVVV